MKKIIKNNLLGFILGTIIFGSVGVLATNYLLKAEDVEYRDNKNLQDAIDELYGMADNQKGSNEPLTISASVSGSNIELTYTGTYTDIKCLYGLNESYGSIGTINGNKCNIAGTPGELYYYKIIASNNDGKIYEGDGFIGTNAGATVVTTGIPTGTVAVIYMDPTNLGNSCNASNSVSTTGTKTGCMKWYAYKLENGKYTMILDHNTTAGIAYNTSGYNYSPETIQPEINALTSTHGWNSSLSPRLISADEVAQIVNKTGWSSSASSSDTFIFAPSSNTYAWLFDYTMLCTSSGSVCNIPDGSTAGYWTSSRVYLGGTDMWNVCFTGGLTKIKASHSSYGLRPVITVNKSLITAN